MRWKSHSNEMKTVYINVGSKLNKQEVPSKGFNIKDRTSHQVAFSLMKNFFEYHSMMI